MKTLTELTLDLKLKLLGGLPIELPVIGEVKPLTLKDIARKGYEKYLFHLNLFALNKNDFIKEEFVDEIDIPLFNVMIAFSDDEFKTYIEESLELFVGIPFEVVKQELAVFPKDTTKDWAITHENFDNLRQVIRWQNGIDTEKESDEIKFKNDKAKQILERLKQAQAEVEKMKRKDGSSDLDFADIISAIASKSFSLNKLNVFDLTVFQLYDEFKRLEIIDNYQVGIQAMMLGANKVDLKHWTTKIYE